MGQVVTLMPLLQQTFIMEDSGEFLNQVENVPMSKGQPKPSGVVGGATQMPTLPTKPSSGIGSTPSGSVGGGTGVINLPQQQVIPPTPVPTITLPPTQSPTQPTMGGGVDMGGGFGGGDFGTSGFGSGEGFGESGFGASGDFQQPTSDQYQVLAYDKLGCPIYGYDKNGTPLYGVDQNGNVITDPSVLPCAMKAMKKDESPVKQVTSDITFKVSLAALGAVGLFILLKK